MSAIRRAMMSQKKDGLPNWCEKVTCLKNYNSAYINTEIIPTLNSGYDLEYDALKDSFTRIFGIRGTSADNSTNNFGFWGGGIRVYRGFFYLSAGQLQRGKVVVRKESCELYNQNGELIYNGTFTNEYVPDGIYQMPLFTMFNNNTTYYNIQSVIFSFKFFENDELIADMIPVKLKENAPSDSVSSDTRKANSGDYGLYDIVRKKFYGNCNTSGYFDEQ